MRVFSAALAQRGLFAASARTFQPAMAAGFNGDISYELRFPDDHGDPNASDWWTIEVRGRKAVARRGRSQQPAVVIHSDLAYFVRLAAGEVHAAGALLDGAISVTGDVMLAARVPDMFGAVPAIDGFDLAWTPRRPV
jgi:putative sterol carrier protein